MVLADASILLQHPERTVASQSKWVEGIQAEARRMHELVDGMLTLAKLDAKEASLADSGATSNAEAEPIDMANVVESGLLQFEAVAFERGVELESTVEQPAMVACAEGDMTRVLGVLLDNACKYAGENGRVKVSLTTDEKRARLEVNNTGPAISTEALEHIFDRFWRADEARARETGGYGLGLSIARQTVESMGGTLVATSSTEEGTTFTATFPLAKGQKG